MRCDSATSRFALSNNSTAALQSLLFFLHTKAAMQWHLFFFDGADVESVLLLEGKFHRKKLADHVCIGLRMLRYATGGEAPCTSQGHRQHELVGEIFTDCSTRSDVLARLLNGVSCHRFGTHHLLSESAKH